MDTVLDLQSPRARKARYALALGKKQFKWLLWGVAGASLVLGLGMLFVRSPAGYVILIPAALCATVGLWFRGDLQKLRPNTSPLLASPPNRVDDILVQTVLGRLRGSNLSAYDVWEAASKTNTRYFFENRYMIHPTFYDQFISKDPGSAASVWKQAEELRQQAQAEEYTEAMIIVALMRSVPDVDQLLRRIQLSLADIEEGVAWAAHLQAKRELARAKQRFGGLARDWAYGYTPLLRYLGHNISEEIQTHGFFQDTTVHGKIVEQMIGGLSSGGSTVTLVGDIGVGKTTSVYAFAERLLEDKSLPKKILYNQVVAMDATALISQATRPGELEQMVNRVLNEAYRAKNIILFFDDAYAFFTNGTGQTDISTVLQPALESGGVRLIFAVTPREWQNLASAKASIASRLQPVQVQPPNEKETIHILRDQVIFIEHRRKALFTYQALREAYKLGSRYDDSQVMPGAALNVLSGAVSLAPDGYVTADIVRSSIEASVGVKLKSVDSDESQTLLNLEDELHKHVINQKRAVNVIANALRRSRSGVGSQDRPVGTFLFLGPTGVGKTELSKALALTYFGDKDALIRVDMNQFVEPQDVARLITPMIGDQLGFLGQVRKRPFSVILLDEIEKAHPNVVNVLLQVLDEGVMRDTDNKPVSFKDAIIIATSNAGADEIRRMIEAGEDIVANESKLVDIIINRQIFAPEFINRFDEVVVFRPLTEEELVQVVDIIVAGINKTMDVQKVQVVLSEPAKKWLVHKGYDSRLGARPMRRMAQRYVENILAKRLLERSAGSGSTIQLDVPDFEQIDGQE